MDFDTQQLSPTRSMDMENDNDVTMPDTPAQAQHRQADTLPKVSPSMAREHPNGNGEEVATEVERQQQDTTINVAYVPPR